MIEQLDSTPKSNPSLVELVKEVLSPSGIGDTENNLAACRFSLTEPELWPRVKRVKTYEEYIRETYQPHPGLADAVIAASDKSFVEKYNAIVQRIKATMGEGVVSQEQADTITAIIGEAKPLIDNYCRTLRS